MVNGEPLARRGRGAGCAVEWGYYPGRDGSALCQFHVQLSQLGALPAAEVQRLAATVEPFPFERIYGAWWDKVIPADGQAVVARSAARYVAAIEGRLPAQSG